MNRKYGKIDEGVLIFAPVNLIIDDMQVFNAEEADYLAAGYLPIQRTIKPDDNEWQAVYTEVGGVILQSWVYQGKVHDHVNFEVLNKVSPKSLSGVPAVHTLPTDATDGDMCLYSPMNIMESGKRIYFDWEEFAKPVEEYYEIGGWAQYYDDSLYEANGGNAPFDFNSTRGAGGAFFQININTPGYLETYNVSFDENGSLMESFYVKQNLSDDSYEETYYTNIDELPRYIDVPVYDFFAEGWNQEAPVPFFYAPYRLMFYRAGEWQSIKDNSEQHVTPEEFGAVGDGVTDDSGAIMTALFTGYKVIFDGSKTYAIGSTIVISPNTHVDFCGATIIPLANIDVLRIKPGAQVKNLIIRCTGVEGWSSSAMVFYAGDSFHAYHPTVISNVKLYNDLNYNSGKIKAGNGFYLYADELEQVIEGLNVTNCLTSGFYHGIYIYSFLTDTDNTVDRSVFIGGNNFDTYWSYRDTYGIRIDAPLETQNKVTNNYFTNFNIQSDYYGGSINAIKINGFQNYFNGGIYDYSLLTYQPSTAVYFDQGSQQNTLYVTTAAIDYEGWCVDKGGDNVVAKYGRESETLLPCSTYSRVMTGNQDDILAFVDKRAECTLNSLDNEPIRGNISDIFNPSPNYSLIYRSANPDTEESGAVITIKLNKVIGKITHFILQFGKHTPPKKVKVTLYNSTETRDVYNTETNYNRTIAVPFGTQKVDYMYDVSQIIIQLGGFNYISTNNVSGDTYGEWSLERVIAVDGFETGNTWLRRDGGDIYGNLKFKQGAGVVLADTNGKKYLLSVNTDGTLTTTEYVEKEEDIEVAVLIPTMAAGATWFNAEKAGIEQSTVTSVTFDTTYQATGNEDASWACDADFNGNIMAYLNGSDITITPTTGATNVYLNTDSTGMFANDKTNATFSSLQMVAGSECWLAKPNTNITSLLQDNRVITEPVFIPEGVTILTNAFAKCTVMTSMPNIPKTAKNLNYFVSNCFQINSTVVNGKNVEVPEGVTRLKGAFYNCKNLNGTIEINANSENIVEYASCFENTSMTSGAVTLTGTCTLLAELAATNTNGKVVVGQ